MPRVCVVSVEKGIDMPPRSPYRPGNQPAYRPVQNRPTQYFPQQPQQPQPAPLVVQPVIQQQPAIQPEKPKVVYMREQKPASMMEYIMKHPIAPALGAVLWAVSQFTDEPTPPTVPTDLPDNLKAQWQMVFAQNQQKFQRRMGLFEKAGEVLLGYASVNTILDAVQRNKK